MSNKKIQADMLNETVMRILEEYGDDAKEAVEQSAKECAKKARQQLRANSPGTGKYKRSWSIKTERTRFGTTSIVYSKKPGLPHLLEYPHMMRNGRASRPIVHIAPVNDSIQTLFEQEVKKRLENA